MKASMMRQCSTLENIIHNSEERFHDRKLILKKAVEAMEAKKRKQEEEARARREEEMKEAALGSTLQGIKELIKMDVKNFTDASKLGRDSDDGGSTTSSASL